MNFSKLERKILSMSFALSLILTIPVNANAMHIIEGYLPIGYCVAWGAVSLPFVVWGTLSIKHIIKEHRKAILLLAMMGAYAFVLSALKIPSVTGSSSHPTGTGLGAVLFGAAPMAVIGTIVLLFQAILLAHGGITTIGANVFSMAIAGPFATYFIYKGLKSLKINKPLCVGISCAIGNLLTYCVTSVQLGIAHPSEIGGVSASIIKFMGIFAATQVPLAIVEGILSAVVIISLEAFARPELKEIGYFERLQKI